MLIPTESQLLKLSSAIVAQTVAYIDALSSQNHHTGAKSSCLQNVQLKEQVNKIMQACQALQTAVSEPSEWVVQAAWSYTDSVAICLAIDMGLPQFIKKGSNSTSIGELVEAIGGSQALIERVMRQCIHRFIFEEPEPGHYLHNRNSELLLTDNFGSLVHYLVDDGLLCGAFLSRTMRQSGYTVPESPQKAAFCSAFQTNLTLYDYYHTIDLNRGKRFSRAMAGHYDGPLDPPIETIFPFEEIEGSALIVDIGGGNGQHALRLATKYPNLSCVIQDHTNVLAAAEKENSLPSNLERRITWQGHDMFSPQPQKGADIYLLSHVLMDHTDEECRKALAAIVEAMDAKKSRILIHDFVDPATVGISRPRVLDMLDLHMLASLNARSRSQVEWNTLISSASENLAVNRVWTRPDGVGVVEVVLVQHAGEVNDGL